MKEVNATIYLKIRPVCAIIGTEKGMKSMTKRIAAMILALTLMIAAAPSALADREVELTEEQEERLYDAALAALETCIEEDMTDLEKLTVLHDWLCLNCDYGNTLRGGTAYGAIVEGNAVCTGYAAALAYLADLAGLDGAYTYSEELDHAWALVTLDGGRYFSDATWDDGKYARLGLIRHKYFLFDENNAEDIGHTGWDSVEQVPGGELEAVPWAAAVTRVIFQGDWCWYIDGDFSLWRCDRDTWETELLLDLDKLWPVWDEPGYVYTEVYSSLVLIDDRLWFNTPYEICDLALDGTDLQTELVPDISEGYVYGLGVQDGALCYSIADAPDAVLYDVLETDIDASAAWGYAPPVEDASATDME